MTDLTILFQQYLKSLNIMSKPIAENMLTFNMNNRNYIFEAEQKDPFFFRICIPNINFGELQIPDYEVMNELTNKYKVADVVRIGNSVWIIAASFVYSTENINLLFTRIISVADTAYQGLVEKISNHE